MDTIESKAYSTIKVKVVASAGITATSEPEVVVGVAMMGSRIDIEVAHNGPMEGWALACKCKFGNDHISERTR